ncbi:MAG: hypothetical protein IJ844_07795 [Prevotella sp.]|nr:hypothetical protein [Prevotella sp.]
MNIRTITLLIISTTMVISCGVKQSEYDSIKAELGTAKEQVKQDSVRISNLWDTIRMLSLPANQRISLINEQVSNGEFTQARRSIDELNRLFPDSKESQQTSVILERIDNLIAKQKAEEERIKALGFKALKANTIAVIDYNKVSFSNITTSSTFVFDSYGDSYRYRTADRGNVYITAVMSVTSSSKNPDLPTLAVYSINGDQMNLEGIMDVRFARWRDYGHYLGNYPDYSNDFAKTSTIRFKLGKEVSSDVMKNPYAIVLKKYNGLSRKNDRYENPPVSYNGYIGYPYMLSLDDFTRDNAQYVVIKIANL